MKNRKLMLVVGLVAGMGISAIAEPVIKDVKALFNPTIKYTLDGEAVLEGKGALVFEDKVYLPVRDASNVLGVGIDYKDKTVIFSTVKEEEEVIDATKIEEEATQAEEVELTKIEEAKKVEEEEVATEEKEVEAEEDEEKEETTEEDAK